MSIFLFLFFVYNSPSKFSRAISSWLNRGLLNGDLASTSVLYFYGALIVWFRLAGSYSSSSESSGRSKTLCCAACGIMSFFRSRMPMSRLRSVSDFRLNLSIDFSWFYMNIRHSGSESADRSLSLELLTFKACRLCFLNSFCWLGRKKCFLSSSTSSDILISFTMSKRFSTWALPLRYSLIDRPLRQQMNRSALKASQLPTENDRKFQNVELKVSKSAGIKAILAIPTYSLLIMLFRSSLIWFSSTEKRVVIFFLPSAGDSFFSELFFLVTGSCFELLASYLKF